MTTTEPLFCTICPPRFRKLRGEDERRVGRCWEHKNQPITGIPASHPTPPQAPITSYGPAAMTLEDLEDEQDTKIAGYILAGQDPSGSDGLSLAATVSVWARDATQVSIDGAVGTAYQARCVHADGSTVQRTYIVVKDPRPTPGYVYYIAVQKTVFPAGKNGEHAPAPEAPTYEHPQSYGHNDLAVALAEARDCALDAGWVSAP
jgi:hypothetical protein